MQHKHETFAKRYISLVPCSLWGVVGNPVPSRGKGVGDIHVVRYMGGRVSKAGIRGRVSGSRVSRG